MGVDGEFRSAPGVIGCCMRQESFTGTRGLSEQEHPRAGARQLPLSAARVLSPITPVLVKNCAAGYLIDTTRA